MSQPPVKTLSSLPPRAGLRHIAWSWLGGAMGIALVAFLGQVSGVPLLMAPLGASAVLAFGVPDSPLAQPRNIVGGHVLTAFVGLVFLTLFGADWWVMALAVATGIAVMQATRTVHPPAGANPLLVLMLGLGWDFLLFPVLAGALVLTLVAILFNRLAPGREYPQYWL